MTLPWQTAQAPIAFAAAFLFAQLSRAAGVPVAFCVAKEWVGIPCPGCGITTSIEALLHGRWNAALDANPAGPCVVAFVIVQCALAAAAIFRPRLSIARCSRVNDRALATVLLTVWWIRLN